MMMTRRKTVGMIGAFAADDQLGTKYISTQVVV